MNKQKLPEWFKSEPYEKGNTVKNKISGKEFKLTAEELTMYDFILGSRTMMEKGMGNEGNMMAMRNGLFWFRENNLDAYLVLLNN